MARLGPRPKKSPRKSLSWVHFLRPFPGNEAHKLFSGGPKWGVLGGGQIVYVEKVYVLFQSLNRVENESKSTILKYFDSFPTPFSTLSAPGLRGPRNSLDSFSNFGPEGRK